MSEQHAKAVCRLYKQALKLSLDWLIDRRKHRAFALALRSKFDELRSVTDAHRQAQLLQAGQHLLYKYRHPEPYICKPD
jgi:NADH dehydrogenase (ubiquinone) 1 beta subcomplex subunit 9